MTSKRLISSKTHIADLLNRNLNSIGSNLILNSDSNEIGEQIAHKIIGNRSVEVIREEGEHKFWICFQCDAAYLGSTLTDNVVKVSKAIKRYLEDKIELKEFYESGIVIKSPIDISKLNNNEQIIFELIWHYFLRPAQTDRHEPKEWLIIKQTAQKLKALASAKNLVPYRSLNRLCFSYTNDSINAEFPCLGATIKEDKTKEFSIGIYPSNALKSGTENEIIEAFKQILAKLS